jgi:D-inositol-3-phosphate glycosyltransferase
MKVLFVLENYHPHIGGVERVFKSLAEGLVRKGHKVVVITHRMHGTKKKEILNGVAIKRINCKGSRYWFTVTSVPSVIKYARRADVIHTTTYNGAPPAWLASALTKKPVIITVHEIWGSRWRQLSGIGFIKAKLHQFLEVIIIKLGYDKYVTVSNSTSRQLSRLIPNIRAQVIYNGVDYERWNSKTKPADIRRKFKLNKGYIALFYGRPGISKGLEILIRAVPKIVKELPNFHLIGIVSRDKAYKSRLDLMKRLVSALKIQERVTFLEPVNGGDLPAYVQAVDCVVVPSLSEGFGFVVAEASALNKPVIASNVDSIPEVISGNGILFNRGDSDDLAKGVVNAYHKRFKWTPLRKFSIESNITNYLKLYRAVCKDGN